MVQEKNVRKIHLTDQEESVLEKNLVWILASPRSGTTWLATELLSDYTDCFHEPLIGQHLGWTKPSGLNQVRRIDIEKNRPHYFFSEKYRFIWQLYLKKLILHRIYFQFPTLEKKIVIKEPNGSIGADIISQCLPNSKIIVMIRDGRDILASQLTALSKGGYAAAADKNFEPLSGGRKSHFIKEQSIRWVELVDILMKAYQSHSDDSRLLLRYESLRENTKTELKNIFKFLDININETELEKIVSKYSFENLSSESKGIGTTRQFAIAGKWKEVFSSGEQKIIENIEKDKLLELGYQC